MSFTTHTDPYITHSGFPSSPTNAFVSFCQFELTGTNVSMFACVGMWMGGVVEHLHAGDQVKCACRYLVTVYTCVHVL